MIPKIIKKPDSYIDLTCENGQPSYTIYKFNKKMYTNCYEYIHFWRNGEGKWKCFKIYLEKGNILWYEWKNHLKGLPTRYKFE